MWNEIEKHIETHRDELDADLPGDAIWEGIAAGLDARRPRKRPLREHIFSRAPYWKVAAIVLLTTGASYFSFHPQPTAFLTQVGTESAGDTQGQETQEKAEATAFPLPDPELAELDAYYLNQFNERWEELHRYDLHRFQFVGQFMQELAEVDHNYRELRQEIAEEGYHRHMIEGLIKTHELKIKILESLLIQIKNDEQSMGSDAESGVVPL